VYDMENRLVSTSGAASSALIYDVLGRLTQITANGTTTQFHYDGDALVGEYVGGIIQRRYIHDDGIDQPLVQYNGAAIGTSYRRYLHSDHQGNIIASSDSTGSLLTKNKYDAYGIPDSANDGRFGYTGQAWLKDIGLNYYRARMYSPKLGRFLQTDPIYYRDDVNLYNYVGNDPVGRIDAGGTEWDLAGPKTPERLAAYATALDHLSRAPAFRQRFQVIKDARRTYYVNVSTLITEDRYHPETRTIDWNPFSGLLIDGSIQSPSIGLAHEVDHAYRHETEPVQKDIDGYHEPLGTNVEKAPEGSDFAEIVTVTNAESQNEVKATAAESEIAGQLGEPGRKTHGEGTEITVPSPIFSCKPSEGHQCVRSSK